MVYRFFFIYGDADALEVQFGEDESGERFESKTSPLIRELFTTQDASQIHICFEDIIGRIKYL